MIIRRLVFIFIVAPLLILYYTPRVQDITFDKSELFLVAVFVLCFLALIDALEDIAEKL